MTLFEQLGQAPEATSVYAAGAVLWRRDGAQLRILVIHRSRHEDYSLPKGKVDPGESLPQTAAREVQEETGYRVALGAPLGYIEYDLPGGRHKEVHYWTAEVNDAAFRAHRFVPNEEVDRMEWVDLERARQLLSYERDRELLQVFAERAARGVAQTFAVIALRHAKAVPPLAWPGDDDSRPITARGQEQANLVVPILQAFGPERIITSQAVRCRSTVAPFANAIRTAPQVSAGISQSAFDAGQDTVAEVIAEVLAQRRSTVLCSHSPVMPEIVRELARQSGTPAAALARQSMLSTAECSILHVPLHDPLAGIVAAETHGPLI